MAKVMRNSKTGLLDLPDELLLEILSHYPSLLALASSDGSNQCMPRRDALGALSQTCRKLWRFFRPFIWNNIDVCMGMKVISGMDRLPIRHPNRKDAQAPFYHELYRQLDVVTVHDPSLAKHVRCVLHNML